MNARLLYLRERGIEASRVAAAEASRAAAVGKLKPQLRVVEPAPERVEPPEYAVVDLGEFRAPNGWIARAHVVTRAEGAC